jgi:hypothetical protein
MLSAEPATITGKRYPLLFASGETANGVPIINGQHPHDLFMELSALYKIVIGERASIHFYGGPRAEPALGPAAYPHRASASENPVAPLSHHMQDSSHIATNVATAGITYGALTWEVSGFHGREPDEQRWGIEGGAPNSLSSRLTINPTARWSGQFSIGRLNQLEAIHPLRPVLRTTASLSYTRPLARGSWASSAIWGRSNDLAYTQLPNIPSCRVPASARCTSSAFPPGSPARSTIRFSSNPRSMPVPTGGGHESKAPTRIPLCSTRSRRSSCSSMNAALPACRPTRPATSAI